MDATRKLEVEKEWEPEDLDLWKQLPEDLKTHLEPVPPQNQKIENKNDLKYNN